MLSVMLVLPSLRGVMFERITCWRMPATLLAFKLSQARGVRATIHGLNLLQPAQEEVFSIVCIQGERGQCSINRSGYNNTETTMRGEIDSWIDNMRLSPKL